jgi:hypothetical protein
MKPRITRQFEQPDGTTGTRAGWEDLPTLPARIFVRIRKIMPDADANRTVIPGVNAYNWAHYEDALGHFRKAVSMCPKVAVELEPHIRICQHVAAIPLDATDGAYQEQVRQWNARSRLIRWLFSKPALHIRCKYCGHYTPYLEPISGVAWLGQNNCFRCGRGYPTPDFAWDGIDGQAYIYYRRSVTEEVFYREFESNYDVEI